MIHLIIWESKFIATILLLKQYIMNNLIENILTQRQLNFHKNLLVSITKVQYISFFLLEAYIILCQSRHYLRHFYQGATGCASITYPGSHHYDDPQTYRNQERIEGVFVIHHPHRKPQHPQGHQKTVGLLWETSHGKGRDPERKVWAQEITEAEDFILHHTVLVETFAGVTGMVKLEKG